MPTSKKISVDVKSRNEFFARGKKIAHLVDKGEEIPYEKTIWFEDVNDFNKFISENKIMLLTLIKKHPGSIAELARLINRNRSAVTRDVNELENWGLITTARVSNPGHGITRMVKPIAKNLVLQIKI